MPHDPAGGIGLSDPSSTPRRGRFRHRNGDVIASPAQRSPGTLSPDGSHLYPVEVQSDTAGGRYVASHWHLPRDTGSRARALWEDDLRMAAELARTTAGVSQREELEKTAVKRDLRLRSSQEKERERQEEEEDEQRRIREKDWVRERERELREAEIELNQRRLEERILRLGLEQRQQQLHLESARSLQNAYSAATSQGLNEYLANVPLISLPTHQSLPIEDVLYATVKNLRARLTSFYQRFAPHKLARVEAIVASFVSRGSSSEALSHLNDELRATYGSDLDSCFQSSSAVRYQHLEDGGSTSVFAAPFDAAQDAQVSQAVHQNISMTRPFSPAQFSSAPLQPQPTNGHLLAAAGPSHVPILSATISASTPTNYASPGMQLGVSSSDFSANGIQNAGLLRPSDDLTRERQILDSLLSQVEARNDLAMGQRERPRQSYGESSRRQVADTEEGVGLEPINGGGGYELQSLRHAYQTAHLQHMLR